MLMINKEFENLKLKEDYITFRYEPKANTRLGKRHTYYKDLENDFKDEINTFLFSPYIQGKPLTI